MIKLSEQEKLTLRAFKAANGRTWKAALRHCWETGNYSVSDDAAVLQTLRNRDGFGPTGLDRLANDDLELRVHPTLDGAYWFRMQVRMTTGLQWARWELVRIGTDPNNGRQYLRAFDWREKLAQLYKACNKVELAFEFKHIEEPI